MDGKIDNYLKDVVAYGNIECNAIFIIANLILGKVFRQYKYLCVIMNPLIFIHEIPLFYGTTT